MNAAAPKCLSLHQDMAMVQMFGKEEVFTLPSWKDKTNAAASAKTPQQNKGENRVVKRKLYSPGATLSEDEDRKVTPKRRRSVASSGEASPAAGGAASTGTPTGTGASAVKSASKTPGSGAGHGSGGAGTGGGLLQQRMTVPLSERQQLALLMQMTASDEQQQQHAQQHQPQQQHEVHSHCPIASGPLSPHSLGRRTPAEKKLNKRNERGETPLHVAAIRGDVKQMKKWIRSGADVNIKDYAGWTPLHEACNHGWYDVARQLLNAGADVNIRGLDNDTPLHDASVNGHTKLVKLLLSHGANPTLVNQRGKTPLDVAANDDIAHLLHRDSRQMSPLPCSDTESTTSSVGPPISPASVTGDMSPKHATDADTKKYSMSTSVIMTSLSPGMECITSGGACSPGSAGSSGSCRPSSGSSRRPSSSHHSVSHSGTSSSTSPRPSSQHPSHTGSTTAGPSNVNTSPSSGVLRNVHMSHHMDRSSSTPRLTLKFHHVKRHENGAVAAADRQRTTTADTCLVQSSSSSVHTSAALATAKQTTASYQVSPSAMDRVSTTDGRRSPGVAQLCNGRHSGDDVTGAVDRHKAMTVSPAQSSSVWHPNGMVRNNVSEAAPNGEDRTTVSAPLTAAFSPQFEDISDAEDDSSSRLANSTPLESSSAAGATAVYGFRNMTNLSTSLYAPPQGISAFYSTTAAGTIPTMPLVGWNGYASQPAATSLMAQPVTGSLISHPLPMPPVGSGGSGYFMQPWLSEPQPPARMPFSASQDQFTLVMSRNDVSVSVPSTTVDMAYLMPRNSTPAASLSPHCLAIKQEHSPSRMDSWKRTEGGVVCNGGTVSSQSVVLEIPEKTMEQAAVTSGNCDLVKTTSSFPPSNVGGVTVKRESTSLTESLSSCSTSFLTVESLDSSAVKHEDFKLKNNESMELSSNRLSEMSSTTDDKSTLPSMGNESCVPPCPVDHTAVSTPNPVLSPSGSELHCAGSPGSLTTDVSASRSTSTGPKVPPLRIIIPPKSCTSVSCAASEGGSGGINHSVSASSLPYVVNQVNTNSQDSAASDTAVALPAATGGSVVSDTNANGSSMRSASPASVSAIANMMVGELTTDKDSASGLAQYESAMTRRRRIKQPGKSVKDEEKPSHHNASVELNSMQDGSRQGVDSDDQCSSGLAAGRCTAAEKRLTRAAARSQQQKAGRNTTTDVSHKLEVEKDSTSTSISTAGVQQTDGTNEDEAGTNSPPAAQQPQQQQQQHAPQQQHQQQQQQQRSKHKKLHRAAVVPAEPNTQDSAAQLILAPVHSYRKPINPYVVYRNIKKKVVERKNNLCSIVPKPPSHFSDYYLVTRQYVLNSGINSSHPKLPTRTPVPSSLVGPLRDLFIEQEEARYHLQLQHIAERDRLTLLAEQETLRVHCHSARAAATSNCSALGVCPLMSHDQGLWGGSMIVMQDSGSITVSSGGGTGEPVHEDREQRSRYGSRHFISWMQDVQEKFEHLKDEMRLRQHHEADVLCAVQRLDWEWKLREAGISSLVDTTSSAAASITAEEHVPLVPVDDELTLVPV